MRRGVCRNAVILQLFRCFPAITPCNGIAVSVPFVAICLNKKHSKATPHSINLLCKIVFSVTLFASISALI